jgi:acetyl esterase/lipase
MLYRGMDRAALDAAYNNTAAVGQAKRDEYVDDWSKRSDVIRQTPGAKIDLRYGDGARHRLDVFPCGKPGAPTLAYIHGGYWQTNDKEPYAFLGEGLLAAGFNLALIEYTLAPAARMDQIVSEVRRAVAWVIDHAKELGGDPTRVYVSGHSAGGHLTAMMMTETRLAGGVAISGIYDLEPIRHTPLDDACKLTDGEVANLSPMFLPPRCKAPMAVVVGAAESAEFNRQAVDFAAAWRKHGIHAEVIAVPRMNHFTVLDELARPGSGIFRAALRLMGRG